jgi:hypothetical protein
MDAQPTNIPPEPTRKAIEIHRNANSLTAIGVLALHA